MFLIQQLVRVFAFNAGVSSTCQHQVSKPISALKYVTKIQLNVPCDDSFQASFKHVSWLSLCIEMNTLRKVHRSI